MRGLPIWFDLSAIARPCAVVGISIVSAVAIAWVPPAAAAPERSTQVAASPNNRSTASLAQHLKQIKAKMYGAFWCPYCQRQMALFGQDVFTQHIQYIECDPRGQRAQPKLCRDAKITGFPTWEIKGKLYQGMHSLDELAKLSGYKGPRNF